MDGGPGRQAKVCQHRRGGGHNTHSKSLFAECHAAARDGGQESHCGPSGGAVEAGSAALPLGGA